MLHTNKGFSSHYEPKVGLVVNSLLCHRGNLFEVSPHIDLCLLTKCAHGLWAIVNARWVLLSAHLKAGGCGFSLTHTHCTSWQLQFHHCNFILATYSVFTSPKPSEHIVTDDLIVVLVFANPSEFRVL